MKVIKYIFMLLFTVLAILFIATFFNSYHQILDSLSHFRVYIASGVLILALILIPLLKRVARYIFILISISLALYLFFITRPYKPPVYKNISNQKQIKYLQFNMNFRNSKVDEFKRFLKEERPDIITLQEVTKAHQSKLEEFKKEYPYQSYCPFYPVVGGVAILSKYPFVNKEPNCVAGSGLIIEDISIGDRVLRVGSIHLHWPYPYGQYSQVDNFLPRLKDSKSAKIISGDFNAAPWSYIVKRVANASNTTVVGGLRWTIELEHQLPYIPFLKLPIDQVLVSKDILVLDIKTLKHFGSDHYAVETQFLIK